MKDELVAFHGKISRDIQFFAGVHARELAQLRYGRLIIRNASVLHTRHSQRVRCQLTMAGILSKIDFHAQAAKPVLAKSVELSRTYLTSTHKPLAPETVAPQIEFQNVTFVLVGVSACVGRQLL